MSDVELMLGGAAVELNHSQRQKYLASATSTEATTTAATHLARSNQAPAPADELCLEVRRLPHIQQNASFACTRRPNNLPARLNLTRSHSADSDSTTTTSSSATTSAACSPFDHHYSLVVTPSSAADSSAACSFEIAIPPELITLMAEDQATAIPMSQPIRPPSLIANAASPNSTAASSSTSPTYDARPRTPLARSPSSPSASSSTSPPLGSRVVHGTAVGAGSTGSNPSQHVLIPPAIQTTSNAMASSPCFVHTHLDSSLADFIRKEGEMRRRKQARNERRVRRASQAKQQQQAAAAAAAAAAPARTSQSPPSDAPTTPRNRSLLLPQMFADDNYDGSSTEAEDSSDDEAQSLTRQLAETAVSVREMSKQLGRARVRSNIQSIMIITKARDNHLIKLTRDLTIHLMTTNKHHRERGLTVYVDHQLRKSKRFDAIGLERDYPHCFKPMPIRRFSRHGSSSSLAADMATATNSPRATNHSLSVALSSRLMRSLHERQVSGDGQLTTSQATFTNGGNGDAAEDGQLRYWTAEMCTKSPHLFDFVVTLGGDGTVLFASWLFQRVVPPVIPFALGSLGFLTNFDFARHAAVMEGAIADGVRVNLRMRFTCTVYRAVAQPENDPRRRRAVRSGKTGEIFMADLETGGWGSIEGGTGVRGAVGTAAGPAERRDARDREVLCFSTQPVEQFEVLNDLVVDRGPSPYVSLLELFGDEHHMTTVQADGLCVATPTGSTAYSLSAGGSLVHPEIPALLISPICPHTLSFRPMLLPDSMELRICVPFNSRSTAWASFDGRGRVELKQGDHIKVTASRYPFPTVCADKQSTDWFHAIGRTLKWNERQRQKSFVVVEEERRKGDDSKTKRPVANRAPSAEVPADAKDDGFPAWSTGSGVDDEEDDEDDDVEDDDSFDIDDLSSDATSSGSRPANLSATLMDSPDRFHDPHPHPPKVSNRHSYNANSSSSSGGVVRQRHAINHHRGETGDRDDLREPLELKVAPKSQSSTSAASRHRPRAVTTANNGAATGADGSTRPPLAPRARNSASPLVASFSAAHPPSGGKGATESADGRRAFAVVGEDYSDSASDADA